MGSHPINLALRFLLELSALAAMGVWGWRQSDGGLRFFLAVGIPVLAAIAWGTFAVPNDPSRSGAAPVPVPVTIRLLLELAVFCLAFWALYDVELRAMAWALGVLVIFHYAISYDRVRWLVVQ